MKKLLVFLCVMLLGFGIVGTVNAALIVIGTDSLGNQLIYDDDMDITWYDYTNWLDTWSNQVSWADGLSIDFNGEIIDNWRLPDTVDGPYSYGYDGTTTAGFNITNSEMGHLYYTELGNLGYYDTSGNLQPGWGLAETGVFDNLIETTYWSGTEFTDNQSYAWNINFSGGGQYRYLKGNNYYALAVHNGNVSVAPVPELPVCSSTVVTISDLKIEVENLETSSKTMKVLSRNLDNAQQALDKGNNKTARSWMGNFISEVVKRSNFKEGDPNRIALDEANSLLCGAANVLIGIELP